MVTRVDSAAGAATEAPATEGIKMDLLGTTFDSGGLMHLWRTDKATHSTVYKVLRNRQRERE